MTERTKEKTVTQSDIARELNISVVSVSNALSGRKGVSSELRQKILEMAEEMGYQGAAAGERQNKTYRIGVLISRRYLLDAPSFYMKLYQEIVLAAAQLECLTFLEVLDQDMEEMLEKPGLMEEGQVDGILVVGELQRPFTEYVRENCSVPVIFVDYYLDMTDTDFIVSDGYNGTYQLTKRMLASGYTQIAYVGAIHATSSILDRFLGYRKAMMEQSLQIRPEWIIPDRDIATGNLAVKLPDEMPEAFVCCCDKTAGILIRELREAGYRVPEDIGVCGFDHFPQEQIDGVELTTYDVDMPALARLSIHSLIRKIEYAGFIPRLRVVVGRLVEGNSFHSVGK